MDIIYDTLGCDVKLYSRNFCTAETATLVHCYVYHVSHVDTWPLSFSVYGVSDWTEFLWH